MEGFILLAALSLAMFLGCYLSGSVPLAINFSESRLRLVTVFGAGLLVGTALAVIIPEGVQSIYEAQIHDGPHGAHHQQNHGNQPHPQEAEHILHEADVVDKTVGKLPEKPPGIHAPPDKPLVGTKTSKDTEKKDEKAAEVEEEKGRTKRDTTEAAVGGFALDVGSLIGLSLVIGFVFMLCVDQISKGRSSREPEFGAVQPRYKMTATIGLVVHAAADGIALGAASTTKHTEIQFIVFMAIMLHKAPAAFGLVTFLLHEGLERFRVKRHLLIFSLAAPVLAVLTYVGITQGGNQALSSLTTTGLLMLFSAGTFLYVATVHVLPEVVQQGGGGGVEAGHSHHSSAPFKLNELCAMVVGALLPVGLTFGHSHTH